MATAATPLRICDSVLLFGVAPPFILLASGLFFEGYVCLIPRQAGPALNLIWGEVVIGNRCCIRPPPLFEQRAGRGPRNIRRRALALVGVVADLETPLALLGLRRPGQALPGHSAALEGHGWVFGVSQVAVLRLLSPMIEAARQL